jgi:hypothetical protein
MSMQRQHSVESSRSATERGLLSLLVIFGGGLAVMLICAVVGAGSAASVLLGLLTMGVVWRAFR